VQPADRSKNQVEASHHLIQQFLLLYSQGQRDPLKSANFLADFSSSLRISANSIVFTSIKITYIAFYSEINVQFLNYYSVICD